MFKRICASSQNCNNLALYQFAVLKGAFQANFSRKRELTNECSFLNSVYQEIIDCMHLFELTKLQSRRIVSGQGFYFLKNFHYQFSSRNLKKI